MTQAANRHMSEREQRLELLKKIDDLNSDVSRYQRIFKGSRGYGFFDWDLNSQTTCWNGGFWDYLGYVGHQMGGVSEATQFLKYVHPQDREAVEAVVYTLKKGGAYQEIMLRVQKQSGSYIWAVLCVGADRSETGWVNYISGIVFDISKLKLAEKALRENEARHERIIQSSKDGIWEWSSEHDGFHFSRRCWELLGYDEHDDVLTQGEDRWEVWRELMHPDDMASFQKNLKGHLKFGKPFDVEYRIQAKDGSWAWIRGRGHAEKNDAGEVVRFAGTNMDITAIKQAEERVVSAMKQAEKANTAKSEFLSNMSHELRTPLNAILGFAKILATDESLTREQRASMREVVRAGNHLLQLVNDVLDLARIEAGRMDVEMQVLCPIEIMHDCIELVKPEAAKRHISIDCQTFCSPDTYIFADRFRLKQIFLNLLSNAIKYNRYEGFVRINFEMLNTQTLRISIADSGKGISEKARQDIFKPFSRLGEEGSNIEGAGIGLVITKTLVEQMQGEIDFASQLGKGTQFWLDFDRDYPENESDEKGEGAGNAEQHWSELKTVQPSFRRTVRVLYIEEDIASQRVLQQMLARYIEFELSVCLDPIDGLYKARTERPDLVLLDADLPSLSGHDAVKVFKRSEQTKHIPVIALSAKAMAHDVEAGLASGFDEYLTKPFELEKFIALCNRLFTNLA